MRETEFANPKSLRDFARAMMQIAFSGGDVDGGTIQDAAEKLGLLKREPYDPAKHGQEGCGIKPGDDWLTLKPLRDVCAAPDKLAVLKKIDADCVSIYGDPDSDELAKELFDSEGDTSWRELRAAIAKAEGAGK